MAMLSSIIGFSGFGLLVRFWQLGIQKRNLFTYLPAHVSYIVGFGVVGYWAEVWELRSTELITQKREAIRRIRERQSAEVPED
ncbi:hypothetical protein K439DRAFT_1382776 [Ramaria rubella]|nr:hypothetical protein K439DRAFT_1382776 [Ramaria rubella]